MEKNRRGGFVKVFKSNCLDFCRSTTIHGLNHLAKPRISVQEQLFWLGTVAIASGLAVNLIYRSYVRYENNPVVVSINKNHFSWNITFPGTTLCFFDKLDHEKAAYYIQRKWNVSKGEEFEEYFNFLKVLSNANYRDLKNLDRFKNNKALTDIDLQSAIAEVNFNYRGFSMVTYLEYQLPYEEILTEEGICYSTSLISVFLSPYETVRRNPPPVREPEMCTYHQIPCFARLLGIPRPLKYYIHSPYELPDSRSRYWAVREKLGVDTYFSFLNMKAHSSLNDLRPQQRKCNLREETIPFSESSFYSFSLCQANCRRKLSMELCKCVPHFYVRRGDQRICNLQGLLCLSNHSQDLINLGESNRIKKYPCNCYPSCSETEFILERTVYVTGKEFVLSGMRYSWYIENYAKMAVERHVIFGFAGLLVNLGGIAGFFVGSSFIGAIEVIYFFTIRLLRHLLEESKSRIKHSKRNNQNTFHFGEESVRRSARRISPNSTNSHLNKTYTGERNTLQIFQIK